MFPPEPLTRRRAVDLVRVAAALCRLSAWPVLSPASLFPRPSHACAVGCRFRPRRPAEDARPLVRAALRPRPLPSSTSH